ncbi:MAG: TonB-dependent receptor [Acidobacteria bacterium]|nr:TonB-dependent receptor [Acidobacteriota bacterium]
MRVICALLLLLVPLGAQTTSTEVTGTVADATGAIIPGANVTLLRVATGVRRNTTTTSTGDFAFPLIEPGEYSVTVTAQGFKTQETRGVMVEYQHKVRVNVRMEVGGTTETVEVQATGVALKTEDASVGGLIENRRVVELPLNGRNMAGLAVLVPGVQFGIRQGFDGTDGYPIPGGLVAVSANGQREVNQQITLDGVIATEGRVNTMVFSPSIDAIEELKVQTSSYSAEYGQNNGAIVQVSMKSGTNRLRGTLYEFLRNDKFSAKNYFLNFQLPAAAIRTEKSILRRNQFGSFVSGPVYLPKVYNGRDRTFWAFNYEGRREKIENPTRGFFFPEEFRRGDFSQLLQPVIRDGRAIRNPVIIFDPLTGDPFMDREGNITNIIPASRINKAAQDYINRFMPLPTFRQEDLLDTNVEANVASTIRSNQTFFRIDHNFTQNDRMFVRVAHDRARRRQGNINPNLGVFTEAFSTNLAFQHLHIFSPAVINEFRYGLNKADDSFYNPRTNTDFDLDSLGIGPFRVASENNRKLRPREVGLPATILPGDSDTGNGFDFNTVHQFNNNLSIIRGSHNFKTGFDMRRYRLDRAAANLPRGSVSCCPGGYALAGWLLGYPNGSTTAEGMPFTAPRQTRWSAYFLDEWKVTRKLSANIGLRWDFFQVPVDSDGGWRSLRLDILTRASDGNLYPTLVPEAGTKNWASYNRDNRYFMPRVGLGYRATEKLVFRAGFGWFANAQQLNNFTILNLLPPRSGTFGYNLVTDVAQIIDYEFGGRSVRTQTRRIRPGTQILTLNNLFPGQGTAPARQNLTVMPPDNRSTNHVQWSFDVQRSLPWKSVLTVAYIGSKTSHLDNNLSNFNSPDPSTNTDIDSRRPYQWYVDQGNGLTPRRLGSIRYLDSYANGYYHGLQVHADKKYSNGFTIGLAYTYSKALGEGYGRNESGGGVGGVYQNPRDRRADRGRYGFDVTHNAVINYVWELPFFKNMRGAGGFVLSGWQTNGIVTLRTGFPFNLAGGTLNTGSASRPDRVDDGRLGDAADRQRWYDPFAFRRTDCNIRDHPEICHYGSAASAFLTSPGARTMDLTAFKNFKIRWLGDESRLQFRSEFFNALNTPQFGNPGGLTFQTLDSIVPDGTRDGEIRSLRLPMRIIQFGIKLYF